MLEILYFSGGHQILQTSLGIQCLHDRGRRLIPLLAGEAYFATGEAISANLSTGEATGAHLTRTGCACVDLSSKHRVNVAN